MMTATGDGKKCGKCDRGAEVEFMPSLPCGHDVCMQCINDLTQSLQRTWHLECPRGDCTARFALPAPPDPRCRPRPALQPPLVRDRYADVVERAAVIAKPAAGGNAASSALRNVAIVGETLSKIMGMTLLDDSLYVVCCKGVVLQYSVADPSNIGDPHSLAIEDMKWPRGIAASARLQNLYVLDWHRMTGGCVWRYRTTPVEATSDPVVSKHDFNVQPFGISVFENKLSREQTLTVDSGSVTVLVTCATPMLGDEKIIVYKDDGTTLTCAATLKLPSLFQTPRHSVQLDTGEYVVVHGWTFIRQHRVSKMKAATSEQDGTLQEVATYGSSAGSDEQQVHCPLSLCVDEDGLLLVVDYYNHRIQLLTHHLQLVRHLVTKQQHGIEYPRHVCLDSARGVLYVGLQSGEIHAFKVRQ